MKAKLLWKIFFISFTSLSYILTKYCRERKSVGDWFKNSHVFFQTAANWHNRAGSLAQGRLGPVVLHGTDMRVLVHI